MIEILAPAGNMESLTAALRCGANAIYTGGKNFSARQNANNLDFDEMRTAIDLCHLYNAKLYIAVNTIITDNQTDEFIKTIKKYALLSPDAFIVQDIGAAYIIKNITKGMLKSKKTFYTDLLCYIWEFVKGEYEISYKKKCLKKVLLKTIYII